MKLRIIILGLSLALCLPFLYEGQAQAASPFDLGKAIHELGSPTVQQDQPTEDHTPKTMPTEQNAPRSGPDIGDIMTSIAVIGGSIVAIAGLGAIMVASTPAIAAVAVPFMIGAVIGGGVLGLGICGFVDRCHDTVYTWDQVGQTQPMTTFPGPRDTNTPPPQSNPLEPHKLPVTEPPQKIEDGTASSKTAKQTTEPAEQTAQSSAAPAVTKLREREMQSSASSVTQHVSSSSSSSAKEQPTTQAPFSIAGKWGGRAEVSFTGSQNCTHYAMPWSATLTASNPQHVTGFIEDGNGSQVGAFSAVWNPSTHAWEADIHSDILNISNLTVEPSVISGNITIQSAWLPCDDITEQHGTFTGFPLR